MRQAGPATGSHAIVDVGDARIPLSRLVVRDEMGGPAGLVGEDVLRGTALICSADLERRVIWMVPQDVIAESDMNVPGDRPTLRG